MAAAQASSKVAGAKPEAVSVEDPEAKARAEAEAKTAAAEKAKALALKIEAEERRIAQLAAKKQAEANLAREVAREQWGLTQVKRYSTLVEQGVVASEQYQQLRADYDSLKANSEAARAAVRSADETIKVDNAAIETSKVQLSYCYIHSPIDGRAGQRLVDIGNVVNPGGASSSETNNGSGANGALLVIERLDPI